MLNRAHLGIAHNNASDPNIDDIDLVMDCVNLAQADLTGAFLNDAHMFGANLREANLSHADLRSALLRQADLTGANLQEANFSSADLSETRVSEEALKTAITTNAILKDIKN